MQRLHDRGARGAFFVTTLLPGTDLMEQAVKAIPQRDEVFNAGGQPSFTYVDRAHLKIESNLSQAIRTPNRIISLCGPTKIGKTVLCRKLLATKLPFVWIEGGQIRSTDALWAKICYVLNYPVEIAKAAKDEGKGAVKFGAGDWLSFEGSILKGAETKRTYAIDSMASALRHFNEHGVALVVDDFHYIPADARAEFLRSIKGPVFDGLKLILLSVTHRGLDAVKGENELQGRVSSVTMPEWDGGDLKKIAEKGFSTLNIKCPPKLMDRMASEAQSSPFLMQQLCWEICAGIGVDARPTTAVQVGDEYDLVPILQRLAKEGGHPIYQKLEVGPQSRKMRRKRRLVSGSTADIYKAILMALAATGPKQTTGYDELRHELNNLLASDMPQKNEITSALKHLAVISQKEGHDAGLDWDNEERKVDITDPYLRFYLRWQIRPLTQFRATSNLDMLLRWKLRSNSPPQWLLPRKPTNK